ncbi:hypothetical protein [Actinomycetospora lemnae]|uniref:DUF2975 domain-containing protein n=1 Tax=Actinomycetospora lemnae TaxID=3019891 RepID=A0ABT5SVS7_9PSEU|nr:hypothetical protein [Actinomycetospora sp. DW7H6]MDD7966816.1 hypothetical protein [Actinomycetospora sp. DW7H6]
MIAPEEEWEWVGEHRSGRIRAVAAVVAVVTGVAAVVTVVLLLRAYGRMPTFSSYPPGPLYLVFGLFAPFALLISAYGALLLRRWAREGFLLPSGVVRARRGSIACVLAGLLALGGTTLVTRPPFDDLALVTLPAVVITVLLAVLYAPLLRRPRD